MNTTQAPAKSDWQQLWGGIAAGVIVVATVMGGLLLASQEPGGTGPTAIALASETPTLQPTASPVPIITPATVVAASPVAAASHAPSPSATPMPTVACPQPLGWSPYAARTGDTLTSIAAAFGTNVYVLIQGNCLVNTEIAPGQTLYIPPAPTRGPTATRIPCGPPLTWVIYRVQPGDTLYGLAFRYGTSVYALAQANCMTGYALRVGQPLYVPNVIPIPPPPTRVRPSITPPPPTASSTPPTPSATVPPGVTPSRTPTLTPPSPSPSPSTGPSATPTGGTPTASDTPQPATPTVGVTPSVTPPTAPPTMPPSTDTPQPPTATLPPVTNTLPPPTDTSAPPTNTVPPPTHTLPPPTHTLPPPANTSAPPTATLPPPTNAVKPSATP